MQRETPPQKAGLYEKNEVTWIKHNETYVYCNIFLRRNKTDRSQEAALCWAMESLQGRKSTLLSSTLKYIYIFRYTLFLGLK